MSNTFVGENLGELMNNWIRKSVSLSERWIVMKEKEFKEICLCGETTHVQFKREFTTQKEIAKEMIAFANIPVVFMVVFK